MKNLELWNKVEKTNPKYTKNANVRGNNITSIAPQFQIKNVTEQFGVYGKTWGFKEMVFDYSLKDIGLVVFKATFFFPEGSFPIVNAISLYRDNAQTKIDSDFAKKIETDTLTKAIVKLGFNADIFMGKFDDTRYVEEMKKEFAPPPAKVKLIELLKDSDAYKYFEKEIKAKNTKITINYIKSKYKFEQPIGRDLERLFNENK